MDAGEPLRLQYLGMAGLGLAHELAGPLTTTALALELLGEGLRSGRFSPEQAAEQLAAQLDRVRRMGALVARFRRFATGRGGVIESVHLDALVDGALAWLAPAVREISTVSVRRGPPRPDLPAVQVDRLLWEQALSCLVLNAADALGERGAAGTPGEVTVRVFGQAAGDGNRALEVQIAEGPGAEDRGDCLGAAFGVVVEDDGPGFPDLAVQAPGVSTKGAAGMGVGLALARTLVEAFGGVLVLSNRPEGGARAVLGFSAVGAGPAAVGPAAVGPAAVGPVAVGTVEG